MFAGHPSLKVIDCDMNTKVSLQAKAALLEAVTGALHDEL
jgi:hypothetical protein